MKFTYFHFKTIDRIVWEIVHFLGVIQSNVLANKKIGGCDMKNILIAMGGMALFLIAGGGFISMIFTSLVGGGIEQSYIYPIYGGLILLTGVVVGAAQLVREEIKDLKKWLQEEQLKHKE